MASSSTVRSTGSTECTPQGKQGATGDGGFGRRGSKQRWLRAVPGVGLQAEGAPGGVDPGGGAFGRWGAPGSRAQASWLWAVGPPGGGVSGLPAAGLRAGGAPGGWRGGRFVGGPTSGSGVEGGLVGTPGSFRHRRRGKHSCRLCCGLHQRQDGWSCGTLAVTPFVVLPPWRGDCCARMTLGRSTASRSQKSTAAAHPGAGHGSDKLCDGEAKGSGDLS
ncbi:hypothetical protein GUJ93_ZPchr1345g7103 [Zizania palustris]|uniref:Uncharacterized protein n=1 Tax=Zizania palustris TaxID=103762 RepID=A0A8J5W6N2_ZIZPA|nr:hypothetical protein GUJ93_ZPchr1345g7103 [Zizania palustris]